MPSQKNLAEYSTCRNRLVHHQIGCLYQMGEKEERRALVWCRLKYTLGVWTIETKNAKQIVAA